MMAHIMERYFTVTPDVEITDRLCEGTLLAIIAEAPKVMADPHDYQARANIMWSGTHRPQRHLRQRTPRGLGVALHGA